MKNKSWFTDKLCMFQCMLISGHFKRTDGHSGPVGSNVGVCSKRQNHQVCLPGNGEDKRKSRPGMSTNTNSARIFKNDQLTRFQKKSFVFGKSE